MQTETEIRFLVFIPARSGSKGLPGKNILNFAGRPLIEWTIQAANECEEQSKYVFVSTDSMEIKAITENMGIHDPYLRPKWLSDDDALISDAIVDAIEFLKNDKGLIFKNIILLQPTSPLRNSNHLSEAIKMFNQSNKPTLLSISKMTEHPSECIQLEKDDQWKYLAETSGKVVGRQSYQDNYYFINGAIYIANTEFYLSNRKFLTQNETSFYEMSKEHSIDIDYRVDFYKALAVFEMQKKGIL